MVGQENGKSVDLPSKVFECLRGILNKKEVSVRMEIISDAQEIRTRLEQFQATKDPKLKNTMSVPEMRRLLGLKKTESYWLVHRNFFETRIIDGKMRVDLESF